MKTASIVQLLEVGNFLYRKQKQFKKYFDVEYDLLGKEIKLVLHVILMSMGIIQGDGKEKPCYVVNTDHYEHIIQMFYAYCSGEVTKDEMLDLIQLLKIEDDGQVENEMPISVEDKNYSINALFDLKYSIQANRQKVAYIGQECDFLRVEKKIIEIALDELGQQRYF